MKALIIKAACFQLLAIIAAISFGFWQQSMFAASWMYTILNISIYIFE